MATQTSTYPPRDLFYNKGPASHAPSTAPPVASATASVSPRAYKDFLTPSLHRRFTRTTALILAFCWLEAGFLADRGCTQLFFKTGNEWLYADLLCKGFTSWIPFPGTVARCLLLYLSCLSVFIVRVANLRFGARNTTSQVETLYQLATNLNTYLTYAWYLFSAWFFGEIYIWSSADTSSLAMVDRGGWNIKPRLNENPVVLRALFVVLAVVQATRHLAKEYDLVSIPYKEDQMTQQRSRPILRERMPAWVPDCVVELSQKRWEIGLWVLPSTAVTIFFMPAVYWLFLRRTAWGWASTVGRIFFKDLPKNAPPPGVVHPGWLIWQMFTSSIMLAVLWELGNATFTIFLNKPPLKKDQPLTSQITNSSGSVVSRSTDPNATLLNGLRSKKELPQSFAFWELATIIKAFPVRRRTIFAEIDRANGSTWSQISSVCLSEIEAIRTRIQAVNSPANNAAMAEQLAKQQEQQKGLIVSQKSQELGLPRIASQGVVNDQNVQQPAATSSGFSRRAGDVAKSFGQQPQSQTPTKHVRNYVEKHGQGYYEEASSTANTLLERFLKVPVLGQLFRQEFARNVCAVVFGVPHSSKANIIHAVQALTKLTTWSIKEDDYGQVASSVASIIRSLTATIKEVEGFVASWRPSWTDVEFTEQKRQEVEDVNELLGVLKGGLEEVLLAFGEYASSIGISSGEIKTAKDAVGRAPEMESRRRQ
ncbi:hypothetical protein MBLNU230_g1625t1 [Neophaeotheca triangularis]